MPQGHYRFSTGLQLPSLNILERRWRFLSSIEEIIEIIKGLPLTDAVFYIYTVLKVADYAFAGGARIKQIIQEKQNRNKYAFVPDKQEANLLRQFQDKSVYKKISMLVPHYRYIDVIRTGILIDYYHENDTPENRLKVERIKIQLVKRTHGEKLLKIAALPTTPFFESLIEELYYLKGEGYSEENLEEKFDELVTVWENVTMLVESKHNIHEVLGFCEAKIYDNIPMFIICGMKSASRTVENVLDKLQEEDFLSHREYEFEMTKSMEGNNPRTQILFKKRSLNL